jgi:hypothetical protein
MENGESRVMQLIRKIIAQAPVRPPASEGELTAQNIIEKEFVDQGLKVSWHPFRFHRSIYGDFALHFGLAIFATAISGVCALGAAIIHGFVAFSYAMQSTRRHAVIRRFYWQRKSQNLLGTMPAADGRDPALRVVFMGHADAAFSGLVFNPAVTKPSMSAKGPFKRSVALATWCTAALVAFDLLRFLVEPDVPYVRIAEWVLTVPAMIAFLANFEVYVRDRKVQGANDNLSASAALPELAARLAPVKPSDVELVFMVTGCEEAGLGGAISLARELEGRWDKSKTVFLCMDSITNGQLSYIFPEGEMFRLYPPEWLVATVMQTAASRPDVPTFRGMKPFDITIGGTDMAAFQARGWNGVAFVAIDPEVGSPRHYHSTDDTPDNLDQKVLAESIDFIEQLALNVMKRPRA